jgi:hypothetical protein
VLKIDAELSEVSVLESAGAQQLGPSTYRLVVLEAHASTLQAVEALLFRYAHVRHCASRTVPNAYTVFAWGSKE